MKRSRSTSRSRKKEKVEKGSDDDDDQPSWKRLRHARPALLPAATQRPGRAPSEVQDRNGAPRRGFEAERELFLTEKREGEKEVGRGGEAREDRSDTCQREVRATSHFGEEIGNREKEQRKNTKEKLSFSSLPLLLTFLARSLSLFRALRRFLRLALERPWRPQARCVYVSPPCHERRSPSLVSALFWRGCEREMKSTPPSLANFRRSPPPPPATCLTFLLYETLESTNHQQYSGRYVDLLAQASRMR